MLKVFTKNEADILDYTIDYSREMTRVTDTIISSSWVVPSDTTDGIGNDSIALADSVVANYSADSPSPVYDSGGTSFTTTSATIFVSGGTVGNEYILENRAVTAGGRQYARRIALNIQR